MKRRKILLLSIATTAIISAPTAIIISCGGNNSSGPSSAITTDQNKMDGITKTMVSAQVMRHLNPDPSRATPATAPVDWRATLNGLQAVNIHIKNWKSITGSATMTIVISKSKLITPGAFNGIKVSGYAISDQQKFNGITNAAVVQEVSNRLKPNLDEPVPAGPPIRWAAHLNGINNIMVIVSGWTRHDGSASMKVLLAASGLSSPGIFNITIEGFQSSEQENMSKIDAAMVTTVIKNKIGIPSASRPIPNAPAKWSARVGLVNDVNIVVSKWRTNESGSVAMIATISKGSLTPPGPFPISIRGYQTSDQTKMNAIDDAAVQKAIMGELNPNSVTPASPTAPADIIASIGGFNNVLIHITDWNPSTDGSVTGTATISKGSLAPIPSSKSFAFTLTGYKSTNQEIFDNITKKEVQDTIEKELRPDTSHGVPAWSNDFVTAIHKIKNITVGIRHWIPNADGSVTMDATISTLKLGSRRFIAITITGYKSAAQVKMDGVTPTLVEQVVTAKLNIDSKKNIPKDAIGGWTAPINGIDVHIELTTWTPGINGSVAVTATLTDPSNVLHVPGPYSFTIIGYKSDNQSNFDAIQASDVKKAVTNLLHPSTDDSIPSQPTWAPITMNKVKNVQISINTWTPNEDGSITMDVTLSAPDTSGSKSFTGIIIGGFKTTDQENLDTVTKVQVITKITNIIGTPSGAIHDKPTIPLVTINKVKRVTITLNGWLKDANAGTVSTSATVSRGDLKSPAAFPITITGYSSKAKLQAQLNAIDENTVKAAITNKLVPLKSKNVLESAPGKWEVQLGVLDKVGITLSDWNKDTAGSVTMTATLSKDTLTPKVITGITIGGFGHILKVISTSSVGLYKIPDVENGFSQQIDATHYLIGTKDNGIYQVTVNANGMVTSSTQASTGMATVANGWSQKIDATHYLIGTFYRGVYQVTVNGNGIITNTTKVDTSKLPNSQKGGWSQKIDATHYLIGTWNNVYQVTVGQNGMVTSSIKVPESTIPRVSQGFSQQIDATHYLIGTFENGVYQVTVNANGMVASSTKVAKSKIPDASYGFAQKIDATHYLIGTRSSGLYQVAVDGNGIVTKTSQVDPNTIPDVRMGFSQQIDATHYLIGTFGNGVYQATVNANGMVTGSAQISKSRIPNVYFGFVQRIDASHYLIGSTNNGVYQMKISFFS